MSNLRNSIRDLRARKNLTQAELAVLANVSRKTINTVENGVFVPSTIVALQLARALQTPVEDIFHLEDA
ncbi:MAG TPA: helix-turn-helix transcriptional regulator [Candidatus Baltobacteraceae bacterium]|nr:helix-turn-helix transcriptional regulator [Candidatus Baltobacteraceae bacterium]